MFTKLGVKQAFESLSGGGITTVLILFLLVFGCAFWLGTATGNYWSESRYMREREKNLNAAADAQKMAENYFQESKKNAAENAVLKTQNEVQADILRQNDARIEGDATKFTQILEKKREKYEEIDSNNDADLQLCALCADAQSAGVRLSDELCGQCGGK